ncbi:uncharacterized protein LOC113496937 [Trichoplusia ni]|uniref:Uncharacterized protein LOC113496937 n=1 Tax=Trichoplusia ni TaxID=7111 RepID=A0A7E5VUX7_TRINI|nr:uncharacterized protein LOC113496937 [Trichoplusia ni]
MTNKEVDGEPACDPRLAALLAVHLVSQILDEAYIIANAGNEPGPPWPYQPLLKNSDSDKLCDGDDEDTSFEASKGDSDIVNENKMEQVANVVATSTPQKVTDDFLKNKPETSFIGQGDEELEANQHELTKSTSMFINHLFDMSDVEKVVNCDDNDVSENNPESSELLTQAMGKIMESYVNTAMGMSFDQPSQSITGGVPMNRSSSTEDSDYSFLTDAFAEDLIGRDMAFYIHDDGAGDVDKSRTVSHLVPSVHIRELCNEIPEKLTESNDVARYENAYLSLNRDYEQCSEDEVEPILEDPKGMTLQEVELLTANTSSNENLSTHQEPEPSPKAKELAATSAVSAAASGSRKSSLVGRCRSQGARLLACLRGWWRRRTPGRRKENRVPCPPRGLCPLSPDARRRAASLLDQRSLRSPSPSRALLWKFNTVNEALVNSSHWKGYTFDVKPDECGEY